MLFSKWVAGRPDDSCEARGGVIFAVVIAGCSCAKAQDQTARAPASTTPRSSTIPTVGRCTWLGRSAPFVFQESDYIRGYFEPSNLAAYQQALPAPFTMPARPLIRVTFLDFYDMA